MINSNSTATPNLLTQIAKKPNQHGEWTEAKPAVGFITLCMACRNLKTAFFSYFYIGPKFLYLKFSVLRHNWWNLTPLVIVSVVSWRQHTKQSMLYKKNKEKTLSVYNNLWFIQFDYNSMHIIIRFTQACHS